MADGILFERLGVQAVSIVTDAFTLSGDAMASAQGAPDYRYAMVPHPLSNLTPEECRTRAREVLPQVLSILGLEDGAGERPAPASVARTAEPDSDRLSVEETMDIWPPRPVLAAPCSAPTTASAASPAPSMSIRDEPERVGG